MKKGLGKKDEVDPELSGLVCCVAENHAGLFPNE
jgi:hypothetical protein